MRNLSHYAKRLDNYFSTETRNFVKEKKNSEVAICSRGYCWQVLRRVFGASAKYDLKKIFDSSVLALELETPYLFIQQNKFFRDVRKIVRTVDRSILDKNLTVFNQKPLLRNPAGRFALQSIFNQLVYGKMKEEFKRLKSILQQGEEARLRARHLYPLMNVKDLEETITDNMNSNINQLSVNLQLAKIRQIANYLKLLPENVASTEGWSSFHQAVNQLGRLLSVSDQICSFVSYLQAAGIRTSHQEGDLKSLNETSKPELFREFSKPVDYQANQGPFKIPNHGATIHNLIHELGFGAWKYIDLTTKLLAQLPQELHQSFFCLVWSCENYKLTDPMRIGTHTQLELLRFMEMFGEEYLSTVSEENLKGVVKAFSVIVHWQNPNYRNKLAIFCAKRKKIPISYPKLDQLRISEDEKKSKLALLKPLLEKGGVWVADLLEKAQNANLSLDNAISAVQVASQ
ncbi:MAG: hypothetical protein ACXWM7_04035, partial [Parachlamydiaceae bacterium]